MKTESTYTQKIRNFNRFYTNLIGLLDQHYLNSPFSLTEGRVLYEIFHNRPCSAKKIRQAISIDEGYLSRILRSFVKQGIIMKVPLLDDRRIHILTLTERGNQAFLDLNRQSDLLIEQIIKRLSQDEKNRLVEKMDDIQNLLAKNISFISQNNPDAQEKKPNEP